MKKVMAFIACYVLIYGSLIAQNINSEKINWRKNITEIISPDESKSFLYFDNASFQDDSFLPYFSKIISLEQFKASDFKYSVKLKNKVFEAFLSEDLKNIEYTETIESKIKVKAKEYKAAGILYLEFSFLPVRKNKITGKYERLISFDYELVKTSQKRKYKSKKSDYADNSVLSTGNWYKIAVNKTGVYKLTFDQLRSIGISNPKSVRVFGNGEGLLPEFNYEPRIDDLKELKIDKQNNAVVFYAKGPTRWEYSTIDEMFVPIIHKFSKYAYYFLTSDFDSGFDNQIVNSAPVSEPATEKISVFTDYYHYEKEEKSLLESGSTWYGEEFDYQLDYDFNVSFPNIVSGSIVKLKASLIARSGSVSTFSLNADNLSAQTSIPAVSGSYTSSYAQVSAKVFEFNSSGSGNFDLNIEYQKSTASSVGWLDYFTFNAQRELILSGSQMAFRFVNAENTEKVPEFELGAVSDNVKVWNVSDMHNVKNIGPELNGGKYIFKQKDTTHIELFAFTGESYLTPITQGEGLGKIENQNLHALPQTDYIIISHPKFMAQAEELKKYYQETTNLHVTLVSPNQIYNEFSSGAPDVSAYRDFVRMFYKRAEVSGNYPRYLLLFGNGSYNNADYEEIGFKADENTNYILTYQSDNSLSPTSSFVSDDFFGLLDDNEGGSQGLVDIGIGRFPVESVEDAQLLVDKTKRYNSPSAYGNWQNDLTFVGDDGDDNNGNIHLNHSEGLSDKVRDMHPEYNITKLYIGAFNQESTAGGESVPGVYKGIEDTFNKGTLIFNYNGHGNETTLAHEKVVTLTTIDSWKNYYQMPVVMTATCEFSRFDDWHQVTAGEKILIHPNGGAIAMFSTTRLVYASPNYILNKQFYSYIFEKDETGEQYRLGEVMRFTKNNAGSGNNKRNFTLLGDPALQIAIPKNKVVTKTINGNSVGIDTLQATGKVSVTGEILDENGQKNSSFNGTLSVTVFDKYNSQQTLGQDDAPIVSFELQKNVLYNGRATVTNGKFGFEFIVPKDISYKVGKGKISYYANLQNTSAAGYNNQIDVGGFSANPVSADSEIDIRMYMNDSSFVSGGLTDEDPKLVAYINSETGVNTIGSGIGHDITAIIDGDTKNNLVLNDFYQAEKDTYKKGKVEYQLSNLEAGNHKLSLKVWDVLNNSSTEELEFKVVEQKELTIEKLFNYPNPFTNNTWFYFTHNQANTNLDVIIQIFSASGKLVKTLEQTLNVDSYLSEGIFWDGLDDFGDKIGKGVYFYKLMLRNERGEDIEKIEKLLILK